MSQHIQITISDRIATLRIDRPDKKNALTLEMYAALRDALAAAGADPQVRAAVIAGSRECFSSGNDIGDFVRVGQGAGGGDLTATLGFLRALATFEKPLIAAVSGLAIGVGTTLLLHCDFVHATPSARFKTPFVELALVPEAASSVLLPALVGARRAAQLLLLGETIDAATALAWGLVTTVTDDAELAALDTAKRLAARPPAALRATKALTRRANRELVLETMQIEGEAFLERLRSPEAIEAFQAFMTRRPPDFSKF